MILHLVTQTVPHLLLHQLAMAVGLSIQVVQIAESQHLPQWVENKESPVYCRI